MNPSDRRTDPPGSPASPDGSLPDEQALWPDPATLSYRKNVVRRFYQDMWDRADTSVVPELFHPGFTFRGSLGPVLTGYEEFGRYVQWLTQTLADYRTDILAMVEEGTTVMAKVRFRGRHVRPFFGFEPTGATVWWHGTPVFTFEGDRVRDLWVLGDIHGLVGRMSSTASACEFPAG